MGNSAEGVQRLLVGFDELATLQGSCRRPLIRWETFWKMNKTSKAAEMNNVNKMDEMDELDKMDGIEETKATVRNKEDQGLIIPRLLSSGMFIYMKDQDEDMERKTGTIIGEESWE